MIGIIKKRFNNFYNFKNKPRSGYQLPIHYFYGYKKNRTTGRRLVEASRKIKVLKVLVWPQDAEEKFLQGWHKGNPLLPKVKWESPDLRSNVAVLDSIYAECDLNDPVQKFLGETALSYADAGRMLSNIGTPDFTTYSTKIYGRPDTVYKLQGISAVDGAKFFLEVTTNLLGNPTLPPTDLDIAAKDFAGWLKSEVDEFFAHDSVEVVLDQNMSAKALAGASRIRVRGNAKFSQLDKDQLLYHEAFVHTATMLNGKKQPNLKSLGLGAPTNNPHAGRNCRIGRTDYQCH